jgi:hypothetical protein
VDAVSGLVDALGGCFGLIAFPKSGQRDPIPCKFYRFGEYEYVAILAFPDDEAAAAFTMAVSAAQGVKEIRTTPLMPFPASVAAMKQAAAARQEKTFLGPTE